MNVLFFNSQQELRKWFQENYLKEDEAWIGFYNKKSIKQSITWTQLVDEELCFGWIDGQKKTYDAESFLQKFTPRRAKSMWSKRNREHIARLTKEKRMTAAGKREVDLAKKDGRWDQAYDAPSAMVVPADFLTLLKKDKKAFEFFNTLNKTNTYAIVWRLQTAKKPETRARRAESLLTMLKAGRKLH